MEESKDGLRLLFCRLGKAELKVGLHIIEDKTEYLVAGRGATTRIYTNLNVSNRSFKKTKQFIYL